LDCEYFLHFGDLLDLWPFCLQLVHLESSSLLDPGAPTLAFFFSHYAGAACFLAFLLLEPTIFFLKKKSE
jgi:hypothetical protein